MTVTQTVVMKPPEALLTPCVRPHYMKLETNEDLAIFTSNVLTAWEVCAGQIEALRSFYLDNPVENE